LVVDLDAVGVEMTEVTHRTGLWAARQYHLCCDQVMVFHLYQCADEPLSAQDPIVLLRWAVRARLAVVEHAHPQAVSERTGERRRMMANLLRMGLVIVVLALALATCLGQTGPLSEQQVLDAAWEALEPNTSSHNQANWEVAEVRQVIGREVAEQFEGRPAPGCPGPTPPANGTISHSGTYWYVQVKRRPATPLPQTGTISPTAPPAVPEPFMYQAMFLMDPADGQVVARRLYCVIY